MAKCAKFLKTLFSTAQMSLRGGLLLFPTKQSPALLGISGQKEVAAPPKNKGGGSQRHKFTRCTVEKDPLNVAGIDTP
jgi:hypothetical protein